MVAQLNNNAVPPTKSDDLNRLIRATEPIHDRMAWRSRRSASQSIFAYLQHRLSPEAEAALQALGVKIGGRTLYRLVDRAAPSDNGEWAFKLNAKGDWHPANATTLSNPIAILKIRVGGTVHFLVVPICNDSIADNPSVESP
jgi:hypothetical protein